MEGRRNTLFKMPYFSGLLFKVSDPKIITDYC